MRTLILGLDAFDPGRFEALVDEGRLPNLARYVARGAYARFEVSDPPQSEVSWTSIATGLNPGGHGMFDFVHRDPRRYAVYPSLLPTQKGFGGTRFVPPHRAKTLFDTAVAQGYPATTLWWPATFPARMQSPVRSLPGLGTPDILGRLGVGTAFTSDADRAQEAGKIPVQVLARQGRGRFAALLPGPLRKKGGETIPATIPLTVEVNGERVRLGIGGRMRHELSVGEWSPIVELTFKLGFIVRVRALTRFIVTRADGQVALYALPLQIHPRRTAWHYGTPPGFVRETWRQCGPFLTLGWPQDTTALEEGHITDEQFLALCEMIVDEREKVLAHHLRGFREGVIGCVFDTLDRVQHMFWQQDPALIDRWYQRYDGLVGRTEQRLQEAGAEEEARLLILSDHGFAPFDYKVHLNRWLLDAGYLVAEPSASAGLKPVEWDRTRAYAVGLNSIYLNIEGREGEGIVAEAERARLTADICARLEEWTGPDGRKVVARAMPREEAFEGLQAELGPDILVGYARGYRASAETGLGGWDDAPVVKNGDHWAADHCMSAAAVPGTIFASGELLSGVARPSYRDIPWLAIGARPSAGGAPPAVTDVEVDESIVEERLKGLGYL